MIPLLKNYNDMKNNIEFYQEKAKQMLPDFISYLEQEKSGKIYIDYDYSLSQLELEFKHLVYDYDSELPLNNHLKEITFPYGYYPKKDMIKMYIMYIEFFVKLISEQIPLKLSLSDIPDEF